MARFGPTRTRGRMVRLAPLLLLALALSGCLFESAPPQPTPVPPTPTPVPTPTPIAQQRIAFPTATPAPTSTPQPTPTPNYPTIRALNGAGQLLYIGEVRQGSGGVAVNADGGDLRLLVEGPFDFVEWAPDGQRFVAMGRTRNNLTGDVQTNLAIFDADGRLRKDFSLAGHWLYSAWAPDARRLAVTVVFEGSRRPTAPDTATWIVSEGGAVEVQAGQGAASNPWSSRGRLAVTSRGDMDGDGAVTEQDRPGLWTVDATGGDARLVAREAVHPIGWSADGATLFAIGEFKSISRETPQYTPPTALLAFDLDSGGRRTVFSTASLPPELPPPVTPTTGATPGAGAPAPIDRPATGELVGAAVAPAGNRIALWLATLKGDRGGDHTWRLIVIDERGRPLWQAPESIAPGVRQLTWAPDGARLAYAYQESGARGGSGVVLHIIAIDGGGGIATSLPMPATNRPIEGIDMAWSPDGRWLALAYPGHLDIVAGAPPSRAWQITHEGRSPTWRPGAAP